MPLGGADWATAQPMAGGGGGAVTGSGGPFLELTLSIIMLPFVWVFWICLYPMTAVAGLVSGFLSVPFFMRFLQRDETQVAAGFGIFLGFAVVMIVSRIEYRLAENEAFRRVRHVIRLILLGMFAVPWIIAFMGDENTRRAMYGLMLSILTNPAFLLRQLMNPINLAIMAAVIVGMHFLLTKADRLRAFWHKRLRWIGLK